MNWLAHLRLAPAEPLVLVGNLCGDFVRGVDLGSLHPEVREGVVQHRAIDRFVDAHPVVRRSRGLLSPHRFSGVLVDVFYDHFLAKGWERYGDGGSLSGFVEGVYGLLEEHAGLLPARLRRILPVLRAENWLEAYATLEGIDAILWRMSARTKRRAMLREGGALLQRYYEPLEADFVELWPQVVAVARQGDQRGRQSGTASR